MFAAVGGGVGGHDALVEVFLAGEFVAGPEPFVQLNGVPLVEVCRLWQRRVLVVACFCSLTLPFTIWATVAQIIFGQRRRGVERYLDGRSERGWEWSLTVPAESTEIRKHAQTKQRERTKVLLLGSGFGGRLMLHGFGRRFLLDGFGRRLLLDGFGSCVSLLHILEWVVEDCPSDVGLALRALFGLLAHLHDVFPYRTTGVAWRRRLGRCS